MKPWFFACALALIAAGGAVAQESPPGGGVGGGAPGGGHRGGGNKGGGAGGGDPPPKPPAPAAAVALDHTAYEAAWTQCHLNVDLMRRLACYERLHDDQEAALKGPGGPRPR